MALCYSPLTICSFGLVLEVGLLLAVGLPPGVLFLFLAALESDSDPLVPFRAEAEYLGAVGFLCSRGGADPGFGFGLLDWLLDFALLIFSEFSSLDGPGGLDSGSVLTFEGSVFTEFTKFEEESFWNCGGRPPEGR